MMRQVVLDTETTGLEVGEGHRIVEIGGVEIVGRKLTERNFHQYINPDRDIDQGALEVHGITRESLADKPRFAEVWPALLEFVQGSEVIMHNAAFDLGFINQEMHLLNPGLGELKDYCSIVDSLELARSMHPGQSNSLDALCKRYEVDNSGRQLHGALLDAEILADVYLLLTGGQTSLGLVEDSQASVGTPQRQEYTIKADRPPLKVIKPTEEERQAHEARLTQLDKASESDSGSIWRRLP